MSKINVLILEDDQKVIHALTQNKFLQEFISLHFYPITELNETNCRENVLNYIGSIGVDLCLIDTNFISQNCLYCKFQGHDIACYIKKMSSNVPLWCTAQEYPVKPFDKFYDKNIVKTTNEKFIHTIIQELGKFAKSHNKITYLNSFQVRTLRPALSQ